MQNNRVLRTSKGADCFRPLRAIKTSKRIPPSTFVPARLKAHAVSPGMPQNNQLERLRLRRQPEPAISWDQCKETCGLVTATSPPCVLLTIYID